MKTSYRLTIRLRQPDDEAITTALQRLPRGRREAMVRQALQWYLVPGGFRDLIDQMAAVAQGDPARQPSSQSNATLAPIPTSTAPSRVPPPTSLGDATDVQLDDLIQEPTTDAERQVLAANIDAMLNAFGGQP